MRDVKEIRAAVGSGNIKSLMGKNDSKAFLYLASRLMALAIPLFVGYYFWSKEWFGLSITMLALYGVQMRFMGWAGFGHELYHRTVFTSSRLNLILFRFFSSINLSNYGFFEVFHPIHHRSPLTTGKDFEGYAALAVQTNYLSVFFQCTLNIPSLIRDIRSLSDNSRGVIELGERYTPELSDLQRTTIINGARRNVLLVCSTLLIAILATDLLFSALVFVSPYIFTFMNDYLAKQQHEDGHWDQESILANTRTVIPNVVLRWLYADMNFHIEHHLYPGIPFYNLRAANEMFSAHYSSIAQPSRTD